MSKQKIPLLDLKPQYESIKNEIQDAINRVLESGQFIMGPDVKLFEQEVAKYLGVKHAISVNSGTDALVIGLRALGIGKGDEVITTPFSFFATAESISNVGATPIFVDVDECTFNINPDLIEENISERTKVILPVHLYGRPAEMGKIMALAKKYNLKVVEDCAQSFGARYSGNCSTCNRSCQPDTYLSKHTGTIGDIGAYSFFPSKNLGAYGDGGLITTDDDALAENARMLRVHGAKKKYYNEAVGYNSRLDTLQAAILRVKLPHIETWNNARYEAAKNYKDLLANLNNIKPPEYLNGHVFHQYTVCIANGKRDQTQRYLAEHSIGTMVYYPKPIHKLPIYTGLNCNLPVSEKTATEVLSLPIWPWISQEVQEKVIEHLQLAQI
ncbi:MAG: DegT/DnrJ/EryC1/StrS family aminotransferase [Symploca sp. SIO2E9]|nr:DegT/DnrJ/EryC1/StrS family aminotransferase [Symploca sp. SIO2E9]